MAATIGANDLDVFTAPQPKLLADAFHLPVKAESFDFVFCSLFLHHLEEEAVERGAPAQVAVQAQRGDLSRRHPGAEGAGGGVGHRQLDQRAAFRW